MSGDLLNAQSILPEALFAGQLSGTTVDTLLTVQANTAVKVVSITLSNVTNDVSLVALAVTANIWLEVVPPGGTADGTHRILPLTALTAGDSLSRGEMMLHAGCLLQAHSDQPSAVSVVVTGLVIE